MHCRPKVSKLQSNFHPSPNVIIAKPQTIRYPQNQASIFAHANKENPAPNTAQRENKVVAAVRIEAVNSIPFAEPKTTPPVASRISKQWSPHLNPNCGAVYSEPKPVL